LQNAPIPGRGAAGNPKNRFEKLEIVLDTEPTPDMSDTSCPTDATRSPQTQFLRDDTQSILTKNSSPDIPFRFSLNPYRGCEHGCAYCFARPTHEYLGFSAGLDFETKIVVKQSAPDLLRRELSSPRWQPEPLTMSGVTDCYQPVERRLEITRRCLAVLAEFRQPVAVITKNHLVTRDIDLLCELAKFRAVMVAISITTLDAELAKKLEPRASPPARRLAAIEELRRAGIPVHVMAAPCIPGLNDHELPAIFSAAAKAGATGGSYVPLRLPWAVASIFEQWLEIHAPQKKEKVLGRIREMRGGKLNDPRFGSRMRGEGFYAEQMHALYELAKRRAGFTREHRGAELSCENFRVPTAQLSLW